MWISRKHSDSDFPNPLTFEEKVEVFYEQVLGWQLHIADLVANGGTTFGEPSNPQAGSAVKPIRHSGFAVLHICLSYFELIGSVVLPKSSKPTSTLKFKAGVQAVLPELFKGGPDDVALLKFLYKGARCGLYHTGRTQLRVGLGQPPDGSPITHDPRNGIVIISPERLPKALCAHLDDFRAALLDPQNTPLRNQFNERFDAGFD